MPRFLVWTNYNTPTWHEAEDAEGAAEQWSAKRTGLTTTTVISVLRADAAEEFTFELGPKPC